MSSFQGIPAFLKSSLGIFTTSMFLSVGCGDEERQAVHATMNFDEQRSTHSVIDGELDTTSLGVFYLLGPGGTCTGTLISENVILTAQHCIRDNSRAWEPSEIQVTNAWKPHTAAAIYHEIKELIVPDTNNGRGDDIALMVLEEPMDADLASPHLVRVDDNVREGEVYSAIGYGRRGYTQDAPRGERYRKDGLTVWAVKGDRRWTDDDGAVYKGDSGGPALDASNRVIGIVSLGSRLKKGLVYYTSVFDWAPWLMENVERAAVDAGLEVPFWAQGYSTAPEYNHPIGMYCETKSDCPSEICQLGMCIRVCSDEGPCPSDFTCHPERRLCLLEGDVASVGDSEAEGSGPDTNDEGGCASASGTPLALLGIWWARRARRRQR